jgi:putative alpha-1,2-mannosidase
LTAAGAAKQTYNQSVLDYPLTNALNSLKTLSGLTIPQGTVKTGPGTRDQYGLSALDKVAGVTSLITGGKQGAVGDLLKTVFTRTGKDLTQLNDYLNSEAWRSNPGTIWSIPGTTEALNNLTEEEWEGIV